jgi:hypothetical protein
VGLLGKLFGTKKHRSQPYVDWGMQFTLSLIGTFGLRDWQDGLPNYSNEETAEIERALANFQSIADRELGGKALFHPDAVSEIQQPLIAGALEELAGRNWKWADCLPDNWKEICSTYLKAWACNLNPSALLDLAELLSKAGYKGEAKEALQAILFFPTYARTYFAGDARADEISDTFVARAQQALASL